MMKEHIAHPPRPNDDDQVEHPSTTADAHPGAHHPGYAASPSATPEADESFNRQALRSERMMPYAQNSSAAAAPRRGSLAKEGISPSSAKLFIIVALLFILPVLAVVYLSGMLTKSIQDVPLVKADRAPVRVKPDNPGGFFIEHQDKSIYETISGEASGELPEVMQILPGSEMPANLAETDEGHTVIDTSEPAVTYEPSPPPRIIRLNEPDIVSDQTQISQPEAQELTIAELVEEVTVPEATVTENIIAENIDEAVISSNPGGIVPVVVLKGPVPRLYAKPVKAAKVSIARANTPKTPAVMPPAARDNRMLSAGARGRYAQLGAFSSVADAKRRFDQLQPKIQAAIRNARVDYYFQPVNVNNKGTLYRLKIGEFKSDASARAFCDNLINRKIECIYVGY